MSSLNKLAIRGIRSFDDKQISIIEFFSPVTVIVGHNGSGKTTIIECLKYATTGDQPPNTRGGAFVHDPKMANEKEVKAQVKLRFHAANGTRMLAVRNLSVTAKKTAGLTMKTLEGILALSDTNVEKGGKRGVISTKCAEMDTEIPQLLGVSKSVLENVIFCHQEDSYWPLAEPSILKKKFDDIFEATRYTKALDNIKALRKDRVAELKAENERLEGLAREKSHADKLRARISDLSSTIASKEIEYDEAKREYEAVVEANQKYYEYATRFREIYTKVESLEEKKTSHQNDYEDARMNLQEVVGTDEELQQRLDRFSEHINTQKQARKVEEDRKQDLDDDLAQARKTQLALVSERSEHAAMARQQEQRIKEREQLIKEISEKFGIKGFSHEHLEASKVVEFISRLEDFRRSQNNELERYQGERKASQEEYNAQSRQLAAELEKHKASRATLRQQIQERNSSISTAERALDNCQELSSELNIVLGDMEEKNRRLEKLKSEMKAAKYDEKLSDNAEKRRVADSRRDALNSEFVSLNMQAESRANLNLKRKDLKMKKSEIDQIVELANKKFHDLVGRDVDANSIEEEVERISQEKDEQVSELESRLNTANAAMQKAQAVLSDKKNLFKVRSEELKVAISQLKGDYGQWDTFDEALKDAVEQTEHLRIVVNNATENKQVFKKLLREGKAAKKCTVCTRHLNEKEMSVFEAYLNEEIKKASPEKLQTDKQELKDWEEELERLQELRPKEVAKNTLQGKELPELEAQITENEKLVESSSREAEDLSSQLTTLKREYRDIQALKEHGKTVSRLQKDVTRLRQEVQNIENELASSGSTKTAEDVQREIEALGSELRALEKENVSLTKDRDRQLTIIRNIEGDIHQMQLQESELNSKIKEKDNYEGQIEQWKRDVSDMNNRIKIAEKHVAEAQGPIDALDSQYRDRQKDLDEKISNLSSLAQQLNRSVDKLHDTQKQVERYVQQKRAQLQQQCEEKLEESKAQVKDLESRMEQAREKLAKIDKEVNESGSTVANLRDNIRVRKLLQQIKDIQAEIETYDMEEAAKARRTFSEKWTVAKRKEDDLQTRYSHIGGELSSYRVQLETWESDLRKDFKDINKRYTDQLIKVKMSDMANNDLEKYAKALDNAIMKYHGLKMEEVNDTMRHLWNKTYQGTDIDGIKIRSDVEGGANKRTYNYRVVMTKDQVEMDMRGRCSAGQKMLASIIIRLALSDSFGQNCGILALDEPTNALDTENIDALASSLVDIINERKNHSNFQLIIITHDENFLRKLGQSDVMEYYWRVSRDARQKSVIERQRFR